MDRKRKYSPDSSPTYVQYEVWNKQGTRSWVITKALRDGDPPGTRGRKRKAKQKRAAKTSKSRGAKAPKKQGSQRGKTKRASKQESFSFAG